MHNFKYQIFTSVIEEKIKSGVLTSGDRLPSVREIKEQYQLSITSVQNGYDYLVMKGWVENRPRSGFFVTIKTNENIPEDLAKDRLEYISRPEDLEIDRILGKSKGVSHQKIAKLLIEEGHLEVVAKNLKKFEGLDHKEIAKLLIKKGS